MHLLIIKKGNKEGKTFADHNNMVSLVVLIVISGKAMHKINKIIYNKHITN